MLSINSKEAVTAIRESLDADIEAKFVDGDLGRQATAFDAKQCFVSEMGTAIARDGERAAFEDWVRGAAFGEFEHAGRRNEVREWLQATDAELDHLGYDKIEQLYPTLLWREFSKMAEETRPTAGLYAEIVPYQGSYTERRIDGKMYRVYDDVADLKVFEDGKLVAMADGVELNEADQTMDWINETIRATGRLPLMLDAKANGGDFKELSQNLREMAVLGMPVLRTAIHLSSEFINGRMDEAAYYQAIDNLYGIFDSLEAEKRCSVVLRLDVDAAHERAWGSLAKAREERSRWESEDGSLPSAKHAQSERVRKAQGSEHGIRQ